MQSGLVVKTFQPDFYVTCATVIPVLFLAVAVQGPFYQDLLDALVKAARAPVDAPPIRAFWAYVAMLLVDIVTWVVVGSGVLGEFLALLALYLGQEVARAIVLVAALIQLLAAATGPIARYRAASKLSLGWGPPGPSEKSHPVSSDE